MADTREDVFIAEAEAAIKRSRDAVPCVVYSPTSSLIELCIECGWDGPAHAEAWKQELQQKRLEAFKAQLQHVLDNPPKPYSRWRTDAVTLLICAGAIAWGLVLGWLLR